MSSSDALKAISTDGKNLKPVERLKLKLGAIEKQMAQAIPSTMQKFLTPERMIRLFWQEGRRNPTLLKCDPDTIASSLMTACQLGLEIGVMGQAWLVPYKNSKTGVYEAQFIPGYKGLIALSRRSGEVQSIETHIVYEKDKFSLTLGIETKMEHVPFLDGDRGAAKLVYGVARFRDGFGHHFEWMSLADVQKIRMRSKAKDHGPWQTDYEQMVRKTLIRRMANYLPMSIEFANALALDAAISDGKRATLDGDFVEIQETESAPEEEQAQIEHKPADAVPMQMNVKDKVAVQAEKKTIDKSTGEIVEKEIPFNITPEQLAKRFAETNDIDVLDADASLISQIAGEEMRKDLSQMYLAKRSKLMPF